MLKTKIIKFGRWFHILEKVRAIKKKSAGIIKT
jgi:hypothetical protein